MHAVKYYAFFILWIGMTTLDAQKTAVFNGKNYMVYPQVMERQGTTTIRPKLSSYLTLGGVEFPPIIGTHKDGEYLIYSGYFTLINKRKKFGEYIYDTIFHVYGTFTIRDNKKEGIAKVYSNDKQTEVLAEIPYKNDLIHGEWRLHQNFITEMPETELAVGDEKEDGDLYELLFKDHKRAMEQISELHYRDGILVDNIRIYYLSKKDTVLSRIIHLQDGLKGGKYKQQFYKKVKKRLVLQGVLDGQYVAGKKEGVWFYKDEKGTILQRKVYVDGSMTSRMLSKRDGSFYRGYAWGRDSVLYHFPDHDKQAVMKFYSSPYYPAMDKVVYYPKDGQIKKAFILDNHASQNYYSEFYTWESQVRDTFISGKNYRFTSTTNGKGIKTIYFTFLDSCSSSSFEHRSGYSTFCEISLWKKTFDKKGKLISHTVYDNYYKHIYEKDSFALYTISETKTRHMVKTRQFLSKWNSWYTDYEITNGKNKGCRIYHQLNGSGKNATLLRFISIPHPVDKLILIDTIMDKGRSTYHYDEYFNTVFKYHLKEEYDNDEQVLSYYISRFFKLEPIKHSTVLLGGRVFSGMVELNVHYDDSRQIKMEVYEDMAFFPFTMDRSISLDIHAEEDNLKAKGRTTFIVPEKRKQLYIQNGLFSYDYKSYNLFGNMSYTGKFENNRLTDELKGYLYNLNKPAKKRTVRVLVFKVKRSNERQKWEIKESRIAYERPITMRYAKGLKDGQLFVYDGKGLNKVLNFHHNKFDGTQYSVSSEAIYLVLPYLNDTVHGRAYRLNARGYPSISIDFEKNKPHGYFIEYFKDDTTGKFRKKMHFEHGYLDGEYIEYDDSGKLQLTVMASKKDSMFFSLEKRKLNTERYTSSDKPFGDTRTLFSTLSSVDVSDGFYTYYYKSGTVFKQGVKSEGRPVGKWKFYREGKDRIYKEIVFKDTLLNAHSADSMRIYGMVTAYYDDGKLMFKGYALDQRTQYSCESGSDLPIEENHYLEFYDTLGKPMLNNGSGFISELQASGYKLKEGRMENNRKEGVWVHYSKFGLPESIGVYKGGKREGRWLAGDLGGLNINEDVCYMNDEQFRSWITMFGGNLTLTESFFVNGEQVSSNTISVIKK
jgi:antitoxin component YwqK of YwqJK toxin-antitoxin module